MPASLKKFNKGDLVCWFNNPCLIGVVLGYKSKYLNVYWLYDSSQKAIINVEHAEPSKYHKLLTI